MTMSDENGAVLQKGLVKWFDPGKGYGFILNEQGGADILLHANVLRNFGRSSVADQSLVTFYVQPTARGLQEADYLHQEERGFYVGEAGLLQDLGFELPD